MGDLVFVGDGETSLKGDATVCLKPPSKTHRVFIDYLENPPVLCVPTLYSNFLIKEETSEMQVHT